MTTFAEKMGKTPFDWNAFLNQETISENEWGVAFKLSQGWVTCACGNLCAKIPRNMIGIPLDFKLTILGFGFSIAIQEKNILKAKETLQKIEQRSTKILAELNIPST